MEEAPPLSNAVPDAHPMLVETVTRAMKKEPADRPTAAQLGTMLRELLAEIRTPPGRARRASDLRGA